MSEKELLEMDKMLSFLRLHNISQKVSFKDWEAVYDKWAGKINTEFSTPLSRIISS